ncbi:dephospho-CoA kinase [Thermophilibacter sp. ET337]|uniref:dephospho-CoA kinase n=1 Tax=Thermophilibacter sp. ET337 TaxID=2973084 RepID=UPI00215E1224|nr:dephospho-CoA kinase [Thermophilibacter sp. ET337]MCR8907237.1 dephospho-CoA kinase [Thermophilibacter sp. ET337]
MHVIYLAGGIASGKSTVARVFEELGAVRIDLDDLSREALAPGSPILPQIKEAFGDDVINPVGGIKRELLAERAFATTERTVTLEEIELPLIDELLRARVAELAEQERAEREKDPAAAEKVVVVEVPLLDRMRGSFDMADEIVGVVCPTPARRARAAQRGMDPRDFDRRLYQQPSEAYIKAHSSFVFNNIHTADVFDREIRDWWHERETQGWDNVPKKGRAGAQA